MEWGLFFEYMVSGDRTAVIERGAMLLYVALMMALSIVVVGGATIRFMTWWHDRKWK